MIPQISLGTTLDVGKQLASIRSYLIQLRDAIDDDIHAIGFDNLTSDLRKRIEGLENNSSNNGQFAQLVAEKLKADYITAKDIKATYVTTDYLSANYVTTGTLNAKIATLDEIYGSKAWLGALDAEVARIRDVEVATLKANSVTVSNLANGTTTINGGCIKTGTISADRINVNNLFTQGNMDSRSIWVKNLYVNNGVLCQAYFKKVTLANGSSEYVLCGTPIA